MLKEILEELVTEKGTKKPCKYKIYWLMEKHCDEAKAVLQVNGKVAWRCDHEYE